MYQSGLFNIGRQRRGGIDESLDHQPSQDLAAYPSIASVNHNGKSETL
jgi:hypothetical protein